MDTKPSYEELERRVEDLEAQLGELQCVDDALKETEVRYKGVVERTKNGIAVYRAVDDGADFVFVDFNRAAERIDSIKRDDVIGKSVLELFPGIGEFGLLEVFQRVWKTGVPEHHPVTRYNDERIVGWRENFVYRLPSEEIVAVYSDETERKRAEEQLKESENKYRALFEGANDAIFLIEGDRFVDCNERALSMFGCTREELIGATPYRFSPDQQPEGEDSRGSAVDKMESAMKGAPMSFEWRHRRLDGTEFDAEINLNRIVLYGKEFLQAIVRDITERKQAEEALRKAHDEIFHFSEELEKMVRERTIELEEKSEQLVEAEKRAAYGTMANRVAHELRNPLTVIGGFARRMFDAIPDGDANKKYLRIILGEVMIMERKVAEIVKIAA
jgi:PAS domain S-box-containing protein